MDLATLIKPILTAGELRVDRLDDVRRVQAHREGPRARPPPAEDRDRRAVDRGDRQDSAGPAVALRGASPRALHRRRRSRRRPSSPRGTCATTGCLTARSTSSTRPERRCGCKVGAAADGAEATSQSVAASRRRADRVAAATSKKSWRGWRASPPGRPRPRTAIVCARSKSRSERVVFGQEEAVQLRRAARSSARAPASVNPSGRPAASSSPDRPASARPSSPSSSRSFSATSSSAST